MIPEPYVTAGLWTLAACVMGWIALADVGDFTEAFEEESDDEQWR